MGQAREVSTQRRPRQDALHEERRHWAVHRNRLELWPLLVTGIRRQEVEVYFPIGRPSWSTTWANTNLLLARRSYHSHSNLASAKGP